MQKDFELRLFMSISKSCDLKLFSWGSSLGRPDGLGDRRHMKAKLDQNHCWTKQKLKIESTMPREGQSCVNKSYKNLEHLLQRRIYGPPRIGALLFRVTHVKLLSIGPTLSYVVLLLLVSPIRAPKSTHN